MSETGILFLALEGVFSWNKARIKCFSMEFIKKWGALGGDLVDLLNQNSYCHIAIDSVAQTEQFAAR
jgi:hypothetical protein